MRTKKAFKRRVNLIHKSNPMFFDTETTGLERKDEVIELCILDIDGHKLFHKRFKPTCKISKDAISIHGITEGDLINEKPITEYTEEINALFSTHVAIGFNKAFDYDMLNQSFHRTNPLFMTICKARNTEYFYPDVQLLAEEYYNLFISRDPLEYQLSLIETRSMLDIKEKFKAHTSEGDANMTRLCFLAML